MPYPYEQIFAADPATPENVASNGVVTIFAPGDPDRTPLTITTLDGLPLSNPLQVNDAGFGPAFMHATLDQVAWAGGGFTGLFVSYKGMKDEAVAARRAAEAAVQDAGAPTDAMVDRGIQRADIPGKVAEVVAADGTVAAAAAVAVAGEMQRAQLIKGVTAEPAGGVVGGIVDDDNRATWLTHDETGGPTDYARQRLGLRTLEAGGVAGGFVDDESHATWLTHDASGGPTKYAIARLRVALEIEPGEGSPPPAAAVSPSNRHAMLENEMRVQNGGTVRTNGAAPVVFICDHGANNFRDILLPLLVARGLPSVLALNGNMHKPGYNIEAESNGVPWAEINSWASVEVANHGASHTTVAVPDSQLEAEIVGSLRDLQASLPAKRILHWVQPAINYQNFNDGLKTENWTDTAAGRMIYENHAVMTGTTKTPTHPLIPRDGNPMQGMVGVWIDSLGSTANVKQQIQAAATAGKGIIIRHHPRTINSSGTTITTAEITAFLDFLKTEQDAARIQVMNLSQWSIADTGK